MPVRHGTVILKVTASDIFLRVSAVIDDMGKPWDKLCVKTADEAPAMSSEYHGMAPMTCRRVPNSWSEAVKIHCIIHV